MKSGGNGVEPEEVSAEVARVVVVVVEMEWERAAVHPAPSPPGLAFDWLRDLPPILLLHFQLPPECYICKRGRL